MYIGSDLEMRLRTLAEHDPAVSHFLNLNPPKVLLIDDKCCIFSIPGLVPGDVLKYAVSIKNGGPSKLDSISLNLAKRGLKAQMQVQGLEGVQVLRSADDVQKMPGVFGPFKFVNGCNLSHINFNDYPELRTPEVVLRLFEDVAKTISNVHDRQIIHGDVKPGNLVYDIFLKKLVLIDWFAARTFDDEANYKGPVAHSPRYFYLHNDRSLDFWALSVSLVDVLGVGYGDFKGVLDSHQIASVFRERLSNRFGEGFSNFYFDLTNRNPEVERNKDRVIYSGVSLNPGIVSTLSTY